MFTKVLILFSIRAVCFTLFVWTLPWKSLPYLGIFLAVWYFPITAGTSHEDRKKRNKVRTRDIMSELYPKVDSEQLKEQVSDGIVSLVSYDVEDTPSLQRFETIKVQSNCVFARNARVWGSPSWTEELGLEGNIYRLLPMLLKFTVMCSSKKLDAFLVELPGIPYGSSIEKFGDAVYRVLKVISDNDPAQIRCMNKSYVGKRGWVFEFNKVTFFITTFAPFYPENHARYAFGAENCYILFQPELSFAFHDLPPDTSETNWENPQTVRDKIRVAFREAGRQYFIPESVHSPMVYEIIRPVNDCDVMYEWWSR